MFSTIITKCEKKIINGAENLLLIANGTNKMSSQKIEYLNVKRFQ